MRIFIPMAGMGKRFINAGYTLPKPLLPLQGKPLVSWAVESTKELHGTYHYLPHQVVAKHPLLEGMLPSGCWHTIMEYTPGPLQTVLMANDCLQTTEDILIMDCDSLMNPLELSAAVNVFQKLQCAGGVTLRKTQDTNCSYARVDSEWWVHETREKDVFSPWSTTGPYWFASGGIFLEAAEQAKKAQHVSIAPVYNYLPRGARVKGIPIQSFRHLGTPAEYELMRAVEVAKELSPIPSEG